MKNTVYVLVEKEIKAKHLDARFLLSFADNYSHRSLYYTRKEAEEGRLRGDAYDDPNRTRIVGFRIERIKDRRK